MNTALTIELSIRYESEIRKAANWYHTFFPMNTQYALSDLLQAGWDGVIEAAVRRPECIESTEYVKAKIRFSMFGRVCSSVQCSSANGKALKGIHLIKSKEAGSPYTVFDLIPADKQESERLARLDEICAYIRTEFSQADVNGLCQLLEKGRNIYYVGLNESPDTLFKERLRIAKGLDLGDDSLAVYARRLAGIIPRLPFGFASDHPENAGKCILAAISACGISPHSFAIMRGRGKFLEKFCLDSFYQINYNSRMSELLPDICHGIRPHEGMARKRWIGEPGLTNAHNAIEWVVQDTGKTPQTVTQQDFIKHKLAGLLKKYFGCSYRRAVEWRYPGTYPALSASVANLQKIV